MDIVNQSVSYRQISASTNVGPRPTGLLGIFVSAASATPTITVYDSATTGTATKVVDTFTPLAATFYPLPFMCKTGCYVAIGGTVSCTVGTSPS